MLGAWLVALSMSMSSSPTSSSCTPLQAAVMTNDERAVRRLAARPLLGLGAAAANLDERGRSGDCAQLTPLMFAAQRGKLSIAQLLISSGAKLDLTASRREYGDGKLDARCFALAHGHEQLVAALDHAGAQPASCTSDAQLFGAVKAGLPHEVERLLRAHPSRSTVSAALVAAAGTRHSGVLDLLIVAGREAQVSFGPIYALVIGAGNIEAVKRLSSGGARLAGGAELAQAITLNHSAAIRPLITAGARTDVDDVRAAIEDALVDHRLAVIQALLQAGYRGDLQTPVLLYAVRHFPVVVPDLVAAGVPIDVDDAEGTTPLHEAVAHDDAELALLLIQRGAFVGTGNNRCEPALDAARAAALVPRPELKKLLPALAEPVKPGRTPRALGITCGTSRVRINADPRFEVYLRGALLPIRSRHEYRVDPGPTRLTVITTATGEERSLEVSFAPGANLPLEPSFFEPARTREK